MLLNMCLNAVLRLNKSYVCQNIKYAICLTVDLLLNKNVFINIIVNKSSVLIFYLPIIHSSFFPQKRRLTSKNNISEMKFPRHTESGHLFSSSTMRNIWHAFVSMFISV